MIIVIEMTPRYHQKLMSYFTPWCTWCIEPQSQPFFIFNLLESRVFGTQPLHPKKLKISDPYLVPSLNNKIFFLGVKGRYQIRDFPVIKFNYKNFKSKKVYPKNMTTLWNEQSSIIMGLGHEWIGFFFKFQHVSIVNQKAIKIIKNLIFILSFFFLNFIIKF